MKKRFFLVLVLVGLVASSIFSQHYVLMIPREGSYWDLDSSIEKEINVMLSLLHDAGYSVQIASLSGQPFVGSKVTVKTDFKLVDVSIEKYEGVIMPCMSVGMPGPVPTEAVNIVKKAYSLGIPIAAQDGNIYILSSAELLSNLKYACYASIFPMGVYGGLGSVIDRNIITSSGDPGSVRKGFSDQTINLTNLFIQAMKDKK
jgi:putative intracellular protease/amidase